MYSNSWNRSMGDKYLDAVAMAGSERLGSKCLSTYRVY